MGKPMDNFEDRYKAIVAKTGAPVPWVFTRWNQNNSFTGWYSVANGIRVDTDASRASVKKARKTNE